MPFTTACSLNVGGCNITVLVDDAGGRRNQEEIVAVLEARVADVAAVVVAGLRAAAPPDEWSLVDDAVLGDGPATAATAAWLEAVKASGGPPPSPPTPGGEVLVPPPPPKAAVGYAGPAPPRAMPKAIPTVQNPIATWPHRVAGAAVLPHPATPTADDRAWAQRLADATDHGAAVATALAAGQPAPKAPALPPPLRSRVWAAVGGAPEMVGLYARWQPVADQRGAAAAAAHAPPSTVRGYPSLAETLAFARGAGVVLPDRRYL